MWPFDRNSGPPAWVQYIQIVFYCMILPALPCVNTDALYSSRPGLWRWRRMWKSDAEVEEEGRWKRARCCANDRDQWREWARERNLIAPRSLSLDNGSKYVQLSKAKMSLWLRWSKWLILHVAHSVRFEDSKQTPPLLKLPPELRDKIYIHCMEDWSDFRIKPNLPKDPGLPIPPHDAPITRTSKLLRTESLPIFYKTWRFPLILHPKLDNRDHHSTTIVDWYEYINPAHLAMIRHFELYICMDDGRVIPCKAFSFYVDFHQKGNEVHFCPFRWPPEMFGTIPTWQRRIEDLQSRLAVKISSAADELGPNGIRNFGALYSLVPGMEDIEE